MRALLATVSLLAACSSPTPEAPPPTPAPPPAADAATARVRSAFLALPADAAAPDRAITPEKRELGRALYFDARLSKNQDVSCNSCHGLDTYGVDGKPTSTGHKAQVGGRNAPTVYNAALHLAQFWDGRAADVEAQAKGPVLNPIEMAMPDERSVVAVLASIPGYAPMFRAAFPGEADPITYDNMAMAIGAFERTLLTPSRLDAWVKGDDAALTEAEVAGATAFVDAGCTACHSGPALGGGSYQKLGLVQPYATADDGRFDVTGNEADKQVFKVPSLRNITRTGPYFHDGSIASLDEAVRLMGRHQLGKELTDAEVASIVTFLGAATAEKLPDTGIAPVLPPSGPQTPRPDAS